MSLRRGPYKPKPPASSPRAYRGRALVCEPNPSTNAQDESPAPFDKRSGEEPEQNFVTALVKAFVKDKLKRKRKG